VGWKPSCLLVEGNALTNYLLACWVCLFRRELLHNLLQAETASNLSWESRNYWMAHFLRGVAEPPKCLGPPTPIIVLRTSDGDVGDPSTLEAR